MKVKAKVKVKVKEKEKETDKKQYYWCFPPKDEVDCAMFGGHQICVIEKEFFDHGGMPFELETIVPELDGLGFDESLESVFEAPKNMSKKEIREKLKALGNFKYYNLFDD